MAKLTLDELRKLRDTTRLDIVRRENEGKEIQIIVGMGTCGIAVGAKATLDAFLRLLEKKRLVETVMVRQTGCMGLCHSEPTVEVVVPGMPPIIYGNVDGEVAKELVEKHIIGRQLVDKYILHRPAADIVAPKGEK